MQVAILISDMQTHIDSSLYESRSACLTNFTIHTMQQYVPALKDQKWTLSVDRSLVTTTSKTALKQFTLKL